jgi:simple sugar transport system ATP-binding protein
VLLVSLELEEIYALADRILVMFEGEIVGQFKPDVSEETLGLAMTGLTQEKAAAV